jgi:hypothetical protein
MDAVLRAELEQLLPPAELEDLILRLERRGDGARDGAPMELNRGHYFEVLDRVHVVSCHLEEHVGSHPVLRRHPELARIHDRAAEALAELYQAVGRLPAFEGSP